MRHGQTRRISAKPEKSRLGEIDLTEIAHGHIEPDQQDPVDGEERQQAENKGIRYCQRDGRQQDEDQELSTVNE